MPKKHAIPKEWTDRLEAMRQFRTAAELALAHGPPPHKQRHEDMEIWHYPLGVTNGMLYSIHVAVFGEDASQIYMHMEPSDAPATVAPQRKRPFWRFW